LILTLVCDLQLFAQQHSMPARITGSLEIRKRSTLLPSASLAHRNIRWPL
jgi:hypothetical protein